MCGIAGFWNGKPNQIPQALNQVAEGMADTLAHRGPDGSGTWSNPDAGVALAHRRLSIIDLGPAGAQPMVSASGRFVITYNGEIYNHYHLRKRLDNMREAPEWRGHSDTEVLLAGIETWGLQETLQKARGMFAFALWDRQQRTLSLARDRLGEKPLYYGWQDGDFMFGSELRALRQHPSWQGNVSRNALRQLLRHNYIPEPLSIYEGIRKLRPGCWIRLKAGIRQAQEVVYWSADNLAEEESGEDLESVLLDAVKSQMVADVPLGAFLSGGVDSSLIVALMQQQANHPVKTFTIGFNEDGFNEAQHAAKVARHLGTEHTEIYLTGKKAREVIPYLPDKYDEPFADASQIPTCLVAELARMNVKVCLTGDGGDELFGGYTRYSRWKPHWHKLQMFPCLARRTVSSVMAALCKTNQRWQKRAVVLAADHPGIFYRHMVSVWDHPEAVVQGEFISPEDEVFWPEWDRSLPFVEAAMQTDLTTYLPGDILVKLDRAAMSVGLETRAPLLDHRVVGLARRVSVRKQIHNRFNKQPLREILLKHVPDHFLNRPKQGFSIPLAAWLRESLRDWGESLLDSRRLQREGFFYPVPIRAAWEAHLAGQQDLQSHLWGILMFQAWQDRH